MNGKLRHRFRREGLFWRQYLAWAVQNVSPMLETFLLWLWCGFFYIGFSSGRRGVLRNLAVIHPERSWLWRFRKSFRVFWNFSSTLADTARFHETGMTLDWEVAGAEHLEPLTQGEAGIVLTAHMGNYDLGAYMFALDTGRRLAVVRAAETDAESELHERERRQRMSREYEAVEFRDSGENPAIDLFTALRDGKVVAIQGDRAVPHVALTQASLFGHQISLPIGPFALAMATGARIWPLIISRRGPRYYRAIAFPPIQVTRTGRDRDVDIRRGVREWTAVLESVIREHSDQWFAFYDAFGQPVQDSPLPHVPIPPKDDARATPSWIAPQRFLFALSRVIARARGGVSQGAERRGHRVLSMRPGQNTSERRFVASFMFALPALAAAACMSSSGFAVAIIAAVAAPFSLWMADVFVTGGILFLLRVRNVSRVAAIQQRVAIWIVTVLSIYLLSHETAYALAGGAWLILLAANALARVGESLLPEGLA